MKSSSKSGHHFGREHGFTGSSAPSGAKYVSGYYRGGRVAKKPAHDDEDQDRELIRREVMRMEAQRKR